MKLYVLLFGKSKKKMKPIMIDTEAACKQYKAAREATIGSKAAAGWHAIELAPEGSGIWKQKTASVRGSGNKTNSGPQLVGKGLSGYITKRGFQSNT